MTAIRKIEKIQEKLHECEIIVMKIKTINYIFREPSKDDSIIKSQSYR